MSTPEGRVKAAIKKLLREFGIWYYMPVGNGMGVVGIPDFICCWEGHFFAIEAKAPGKLANTTPNQKRVLAELKVAGATAIVIDDPMELRKYLENVQLYGKHHST